MSASCRGRCGRRARARRIAGPDSRDRLSLPDAGTGYAAAAAESVRGLRVAWSPDLGFAAVDPAVRDRAASAARAFEELGCAVDEVALELEDPYAAAYTLLAAGSAGGHRDDYEAVRDRLDPRRVPMVEDGFRLSAADVGAAIAQRGRFGEALRTALEGYDLLLTPTVPVTSFPSGLDGPAAVAGLERPGLSWAALTYPFNLTGQPAATVPCAPAGGELPTGLQIVGRWRDDATVLRASAAYEAARPWRHAWPAIAEGVAV